MSKYTGFLTSWKRATSSAFTTPATIANVREVTPGFGSERVLFDQSAYGDQWMDWAVLQQDGTEFTMTLQYDPVDAVHVLLKSDYDTPNPATWLQASHTTMDYNFNITSVLRGFTLNPARDGSFEAILAFKIITPGVAQVVIP